VVLGVPRTVSEDVLTIAFGNIAPPFDYAQNRSVAVRFFDRIAV